LVVYGNFPLCYKVYKCLHCGTLRYTRSDILPALAMLGFSCGLRTGPDGKTTVLFLLDAK